MSTRELGNWIKTARPKRVTPGNSASSQPTAAHGTILFQRLNRIRGARWIIAARGRQVGRDRQLVCTNKPNQKPFHHPAPCFACVACVATLCVSCRHCARNASNEQAYAEGNARTTRSTTGTIGSTSMRTISRRRRFTRLRSTAECPYRGTMMPTRAERRREASHRASSCAARTRFPFSRTASSSFSRVSLAAGGKRRPLGAGVLRRQFYGKALAPLLAPAAQHFSAPFIGHPRAKAVRPEATLVPRTVSWLTHDDSKKACLIS